MGVYYILVFRGDENESLQTSGSYGCQHFRKHKSRDECKSLSFSVPNSFPM